MKGLFLDRDGVINHDLGYVHDKSNFKWRKSIFIICWVASIFRYRIFIVTNQAGIAKGLYTTKQFIVLMDDVVKIFKRVMIQIDEICYCPYHQDAYISEFRCQSHWRKPKPGMINHIVRNHKISTERSVFIGDQESDKIACHTSGITSYINANLPFWWVKACIMLIVKSLIFT